MDSPAVREGAQHQEARHARRAEARRTPEAAEARRRSREAHRGLGRDAALELARTKFPDFLDHPVTGPLRLPQGARVKEHLNDHWTQIEQADGEIGVVYTPLPVLADDDKPVELALEETSAAFRSENPLVDVSFGRTSGAGARLDSTGIGVLPAGDDVAALRDGDRLFYGGVATDTDEILAPTATGFQLLWQLRSAAAPDVLRARFELPEGAELRLAHDFVSDITAPVRRGEDEAVGAEVVRDGEQLAYIAPPATFDADGERVPTRYEVTGDTLEVHVDHGARDLAYPLLVDPEVGDSWDGPQLGASSAWFSAEDRRGGPHAFSFARDYQRYGLQVGAYQWATYYDAATAGWSWQSPDGAYIRNATFNSMRHIADSSSLITGIYRPGVWEAGPGWYGYTFDGYGWYHSNGAPTERNLLYMGLYMHGSHQRLSGAFAHLGSVSATLGDNYAPTMSLRSPTPPSAWTNYNWQAIGYDMWDRGLGLKAALITRVGDERAASIVANQSCTGGRQPCPLYHNTDGFNMNGFSRQLPYDLNALGEGTHQMHVRGQDVAGNISYSPAWTVRYDKTAPRLGEVSFETPSENVAQLEWDAAVDPAAPDGTSSGVTSYRVRWRAGSGAFSAWTTYGSAARQSAVTPSYPSGTEIEFQLSAVDGAGNVSLVDSVIEKVDGDGPLLGTEEGTGVSGSYVGPNASAALTVSAEDAGSGVRRVTVESTAGSVLAASDAACSGSTCPAELSRPLAVNLSSYPEGRIELKAGSVDGLGNPALSEDLDFVMDRTAPPAPTDIRQIEQGAGTIVLGWVEGADPAISDEIPGSGNGHVRFRFSKNDGSWTNWFTAQESARIGAAITDRLKVEAQAVDAVGNMSPVTSADIVVLPDALLVNKDPQVVVDAYNTAPQRSSMDLELEDAEPAWEDEGIESDAQSRDATASEEQRATAAQAFTNCTPNIKSVVSRDVWANPRTFYPERTRLGARMFIYCNGLPTNTTKVTVSGAFAYRTNPGDNNPRRYKQIGPRHVVDLGTPASHRAVEFNGIRNFCIPKSGGKKRYVVVGVVKYHRSGEYNDVEQKYNTDFNKEKELVCPDAAERRYREAAAFSKLARFDPDPFKAGSRPAYRNLRNVMGSQPYVPPAVKRDAWNAHHVVPVNDRLARTVRALTFRCRVHPNDSENGVYLRGSGLREKRSGRRTKAFKQLVAYDNDHNTTLHKRTYHPDTYRNNYGYINKLTSNASAALREAPEACGSGARETLRNMLSAARANLRLGSFGVEQPGH